jgi:hypothetical protein
VARSSSSLQDTQFQANLPSRHRAGAIWRAVFQASTIVGIIALTALLYSVIRNSFGYAAIQYSMDPEELVLSVEEERMLSAPNVVSSEDDTLLAEAIAASPNAIGFFGYAYYQERADRLRALEVDGVVPSAATVDSGEYGLARPLFVYSTAEIMREKPQVAAFLDYYLTHVNQEIGRMGYFPASQDSLDQALLNVPMVTGGMPTGDILAAGSSTVSPLSEWMAVRFREEGFAGDIAVENIGSTAGFRRFCVDGDTDIANASRRIRSTEVALCQEIGRRIGDEPLIKPLVDIPRMAEKAVSMLHRALDAFARADVELAMAIPAEDDEVDGLYNQVYRETLACIMADPAVIDQANYLMWAAHNLERTADRVINICERTIYMVTGEFVEIDNKGVIEYV